MRLRTVALVLALAACKREHPQCDKFVDLAMQCDRDILAASGDERKTARVVMDGMCEEAFKNDTGRVSAETKEMITEVYAQMRKQANCAAEATTCDQYAVCAPD
jgi:hypothetical protein